MIQYQLSKHNRWSPQKNAETAIQDPDELTARQARHLRSAHVSALLEARDFVAALKLGVTVTRRGLVSLSLLILCFVSQTPNHSFERDAFGAAQLKR